MRTRIILLTLLACVMGQTALAEEFTPMPINSEHYNKWSTSKHFVNGLEALNDGFAQDAIDEFTLELKDHPSNSYANCNLIQARIKLLYDEFVNGLFKKNEEDTTTLTQEYFDYYNLNGQNEIKELEQCITMLPAEDKESQCSTYLAVANAYMHWFVTDTLQIIDAFNNAITCHPCKKSYYQKMIYYTDTYDDYINYIEDDVKALYELDSTDMKAIRLMALLASFKGDTDGFVRYYNEFLPAVMREEEGSDKNLNMIYAKILTDEGRTEEAIDIYLKLLAEQSDKEPLFALLSLTQDEQMANITLFKIGQMQFAEEGNENLWNFVQGLIHKCSLKDYRTALTFFQKALSNTPGNTLCLSQMANCYLMLGDVDNAKLYTHAYSMVTYENKYQNLLYNLGEIDELIESDKIYNEYADLFHFDSEFFAGQAAMYILKKDYNQAISALDMAKERNLESSTHSDYMYGVALRKMGREEEAKQYFEKAYEAGKGEDGADLYYLASSIALGKPDTEQIEKLADLWQQIQEQAIPGVTDGDNQLAYEIACLYAMMGDKDNAMKYMKLHFEHGEIPCNFGLIRQDWRLDNIKTLPEFVELANKFYFQWKNNK